MCQEGRGSGNWQRVLRAPGEQVVNDKESYGKFHEDAGAQETKTLNVKKGRFLCLYAIFKHTII